MLKVSVIMANYNTSISQLKDSIDSILHQTYHDIEFVIVDDHSSDESIDYLKSLKDNRIVLIENEKNIGLTKSLNIAIKHATGDYIARMDSDDISERNRLEKQVEYLEKHKDVDFVCSWFKHFGGDEAVYKKTIPSTSLFRCYLLLGNSYIAHPSVMFRSSFLIKNELLYDESIKKSQDYDMWIRCADAGNVATVPEVLLNYRIHSNQITNSSSAEQTAYVDIIRKRQLSRLKIYPSPDEMRIHRECFSGHNISKEHVKWLYSLIEQNRKTNIYDHYSLKKMVHRACVKHALRTFINNKKIFSIMMILPPSCYFGFVIEIINALWAKTFRIRIDTYI